jgi:hypothetical protein
VFGKQLAINAAISLSVAYAPRPAQAKPRLSAFIERVEAWCATHPGAKINGTDEPIAFADVGTQRTACFWVKENDGASSRLRCFFVQANAAVQFGQRRQQDSEGSQLAVGNEGYVVGAEGPSWGAEVIGLRCVAGKCPGVRGARVPRGRHKLKKAPPFPMDASVVWLPFTDKSCFEADEKTYCLVNGAVVACPRPQSSTGK